LRYFIELCYNGKNYHGWQIQPAALSVQETIEKALTVLLREKIQVVGCGRTDAGVHASQFFLHFDSEVEFEPEKLKFQLNSILPDDIAIFEVLKVKDSAHSRFDAMSRSYEYKIFEGKNPFLQDTHYQVTAFDVDLNKMNEAADLLIKYSDFKCFSRTKTDVKTFICSIEEARWEKQGNVWIFYIRANRFLRNMVRAIVGTLIEVGKNKRTLEQFKEVIESRDRSEAGPSAKARGLHLTRIEYPKEIFIDAYV